MDATTATGIDELVNAGLYKDSRMQRVGGALMIYVGDKIVAVVNQAVVALGEETIRAVVRRGLEPGS